VAKSINTTVQDQLLNYIKTNGTRLCLCSAQPTTYTEATATYELADVVLASGDYTLAAGDVNGRKMTVAAKSSVPVDFAGTCTHAAIVDVTGTTLLWVTTTASTVLTAGGATVDIGSFKLEVNNPV
jgi:hypothetical protein